MSIVHTLQVLLKQITIMPTLRASDKGPWQSMTTGMVNPMDMWRFRSSVCLDQNHFLGKWELRYHLQVA